MFKFCSLVRLLSLGGDLLLAENNNEDENGQTPASQEAALDIAVEEGIPGKKSEYDEHLRTLREQLTEVLKNKPSQLLNDIEKLTDPAAQPVFWISTWADYSHKYGFGYQLCDNGVGTMFMDKTRLVSSADQRNLHYIERDGTEHYFTMDTIPPALQKKVTLLSYFRRYMDENLMKVGATVQVQESDQLDRTPYLHRWCRSKSTVIMQLSNGTLQINFNDHTKIIMCPVKSSVTYIDVDKNFHSYTFSTIMKNGCSPGLSSCLEKARDKIDIFLKMH